MDSGHRRALLVDFGGVLTTSIWPAFDAFCRAEGLTEGTVRELFRDRPEALADLRELEKGSLEPGRFEERFARHLGIPDRADGLIGRLFAGLGPDQRMAGAVRAARAAGVATGLISNSWGISIYDGQELDGLFDTKVISGEVGLHKPQPEIYLLACERLAVDPADAIFVDDLRENCSGAEAVGIPAILHRETTTTLASLESALGIELEDRSGISLDSGD